MTTPEQGDRREPDPDEGAHAPGDDETADAGSDAGVGGPTGGESSFDGDASDELADAERLVDGVLGTGSGAMGDAALMAERDDYRDALLRVKADFDNYKKRVAANQAATVERAAEKLVADLLPVLDACEAALEHGATDVEPVHKSLVDVLEKAGLERIEAEGRPFDPNLHEAVMHEPGDGDGGETVVTGSLRTGYLWNGRVVRPAMVKVKG